MDVNATQNLAFVLDSNASVELIQTETYSFMNYLISLNLIPNSFWDYLVLDFLGNTLFVWLFAFFIILFTFLLRSQIAFFTKYILSKVYNNDNKPIHGEILNAIDRPFSAIILLLGFHVAFSIIKMEPTFGSLLLAIVSSLFAILLSWMFLNIIDVFKNHISNMSKIVHHELGESILSLAITILKSIVVIIALINILIIFGFNVTGFLASFGLLGMALALAAKDTASNLFGSLVIFGDKPFKIGHWVKTPSVEGTIEHIGLRSTKIRTFAQALVSVPNGLLANEAILNFSKMGKRRIKMNLGLTYSTTSTQMKQILQEIRTLLIEDKDIHQQTIFINFTNFNNSSLGIFCYFFTKTTDWGEFMNVQERINLEIMAIIEKNGASFAFPSQSIYMENNKNID